MKFQLTSLFIILSLSACSQTPQQLDSDTNTGGGTEAGVVTTRSMAKDVDYQRDLRVFRELCQNNLEQAKGLFNQLVNNTQQRNVQTVLEPLNEIEILLEKVTNLGGLYSNVHPDPNIRQLADQCVQKYSKFSTTLTLSWPVYDAVKTLDISAEGSTTKRYVKKLLRDFRRAGVDKGENTRKEIARLNDELVRLGQRFINIINNSVNVIEISNKEDLSGLPADYLEQRPADDKGIVKINTNYPDYKPFMRYANSDHKRKELMQQYLNRGYPENEAVLKQIMRKRYELARLLGYQNYAHYITETKMIKTPDNAQQFIDQVDKSATVSSDREYQQLLYRLKQIDPQANEVEAWQRVYLLSLLKEEKYNLDTKELREYFHYRKVRDGIFQLISRLFGVHIRAVNMTVWHDDVEAYELLENGKLIGRFYLDMHPRDGKYKHAAEFQIVSGIKGRLIPEASLVCNFPKGVMEHGQVETFLHEFGHLIHHLFAVSDYWMAFSGIRNETDFVEAPSQMLEEWIWDAATLKTFASNEKGEVIPDHLIEKMQKARFFGEGLATRRQMFYAGLSLNIYNRQPDYDLAELLKEISDRYYPFDYVDDTHAYTNFGHLYDYSALYYTYMWSKVIALDMFSRFQSEGLLNTATAQDYRREVIGPGASEDAADLVEGFLGRKYNFHAFEHYLNQGVSAQ